MYDIGLACSIFNYITSFVKISQPVQMFRWLDTPIDSMAIPENMYVA
jgi:hypothetical protein